MLTIIPGSYIPVPFCYRFDYDHRNGKLSYDMDCSPTSLNSEPIYVSRRESIIFQDSNTTVTVYTAAINTVYYLYSNINLATNDVPIMPDQVLKHALTSHHLQDF